MNSTVESSSVATTSVAVAQEPNVKISVPESTTKDVKIAAEENSSSSTTVSEPVVTDETTTDAATGEVVTGDVADETVTDDAVTDETVIDETATDATGTEEVPVDAIGTDDALIEEQPVEEVITDGGYIDPGYTGELGEGMVVDPGAGQVKDPLLSSWFFVIGISVAVLFVSIALGTLLARRKIKKGIEIYED
ncbi:MAG: hypothetical protein QM644_19670 [Mobilitalea sp.]